ncbi:DUF1212-domain-containing protein [Acaromyces ingoldii]|uniref:DUF1212-domain-containing protein n=1 Tax=Acaromyces ingoldii TaxID=215250 RepID=A0A316YX17_9BASI|nr:DUF1212-domain-containing protein [Acaromyces ingoldii]PWN93324.1 DUF1212-domain-containing protein [Acaromyces ingoldii]
MLFGAPSHRIESQLNATATVLEVDAQFIHFPGIVIASFGDFDSHTSETHFVKSKTDLALGSLHRVHHVYKKVVHDEMGVEEGAEELTTILHAKPVWSVSSRVLFSFIKCFIMAPLSFGGSIVDACIAGVFGGFLTFLQLHVAGKNQMYSNVFEISMAIIISFVSRGLSSTGVFCYQAIASSGVILVLPGYVVLCGSLELASKNMIAGSVRMVYAIIYSLFLGFGIAIGSDVYFLLDPGARKTMHVPLQTSSQQPLTPWLNFLFVPVFATLACFNLLQPLRSREVPVAVFIACVGWVINRVTKTFIFDRSDVVSAIGSFAIGLLGNLYSRIFKGTAFTAMTPAVLFLVPSGMAMAGGLAMTYKGSDGDLYSNGLSIGLRMIQVSIGITTGLFASCLVVYAFGRKKGAALFAF